MTKFVMLIVLMSVPGYSIPALVTHAATGWAW